MLVCFAAFSRVFTLSIPVLSYLPRSCMRARGEHARVADLARLQGRLIYHTLKDRLPPGARAGLREERKYSPSRESGMKKRNLPRAGAEIVCTRVYTQHSAPLISFLSIKPAPLKLLRRKWYSNKDCTAKENAAPIKGFVAFAYSCEKRKPRLQKPTR